MRTIEELGSCEWFGELPPNWKMVPLASMFRMSKGLSITKSDLVDGGAAVISYGQIHSKDNRGVETSEALYRHVPTSLVSGSSASQVMRNGFIFADTSEDLEGCGNFVRYDSQKPAYGGYHTIVCNPKKGFDSKYLAYLFTTEGWRSQIRRDLVDVKLFSVNQTSLHETYVVVPPVDTQRLIVNYLDMRCAAIDDDIARRREVVTKLEEYKRSVISQAITRGLDGNAILKDAGTTCIGKIPEHWRVVPLRALARDVWDGPFGSNLKSSDYVDEGVRVVRLENLRFMRFDESRCSYVSPKKYEAIKRHTVRQGDLIVATFISDDVKVAMLPSDIPFAVNKADCVGITPNQFVSQRYLQYALSARSTLASLLGELHGATRDRVNLSQIKAVKVPLPPKGEQLEISNYLNELCDFVDDAVIRERRIIEKLEEYKKSLIAYAVTGKIDCTED